LLPKFEGEIERIKKVKFHMMINEKFDESQEPFRYIFDRLIYWHLSN